MLGKRTIPAEIRVGTFTDALDFVSGVNLFHGLPLTRAERRRAVEIKLKLHHDWSDRRTAEELAVSRELVAKIRRQLIEGNQIPNNPAASAPTASSTRRPGFLANSPSGCPRASPMMRRGRQHRTRPPRDGCCRGPTLRGIRRAQGKGKGLLAEEIHWEGGPAPGEPHESVRSTSRPPRSMSCWS